MAATYEKLELLGSGSYGKAWLVRCPKKDKRAVLKEIRLDILSEKEMSQSLLEVKILSRCRHVNIVSYHEAFVVKGCLQIVMEYADSGDLQKKIIDQKGVHFDEEVILDWFIQICFALKYLHSENILHRDLKPQNLFLTSDGIVKVGDFGIARILQDTADLAVTAIGTPYYISPEICQRKRYSFKSDMWSLGCVLYELCCLRVPFEAQNLPILVLKILDGQFDPLPRHCGPVLENLVGSLLRVDPSQRSSAEQILNLPALLPYVKMSYRKCLGHKERRRSSSKDISTGPPRKQSGSDGVERPKAPRQIYPIKSPLLPNLPLATPQLKRAIKRQRDCHSADAVSSVKKPKKGSPLTLSLLRHVMQKPPSQHNKFCSEFAADADHVRDGPDDVFDADDCGDDEVFEEDPQLKGVKGREDKKSPQFASNRNSDTESPQIPNGRPVSRKSPVRSSHRVARSDIKQSPVQKGRHVINPLKLTSPSSQLRGGQCEHKGVKTTNKHSTPEKLRGKIPSGRTLSSERQRNMKWVPDCERQISLYEKQHPSNRDKSSAAESEGKRMKSPARSRLTSCNSTPGRIEKKSPADAVNSPSVSKCACSSSRERQSVSVSESRQNDRKQCKELSHGPSDRDLSMSDLDRGDSYIENSSTYCIDPFSPCAPSAGGCRGAEGVKSPQPVNPYELCSCLKNASRLPQTCLLQALYGAAVLKLKDRKQAKQVLSKYLKSHLGVERSWQVLMSVGTALDAGEDYGAMESSLNDEAKGYLPVVLQLLTMNI